MMLIYGAVVVALITGSLYALVKAHEERKAAVRDRERRAELRRVMQITRRSGETGSNGVVWTWRTCSMTKKDDHAELDTCRADCIGQTLHVQCLKEIQQGLCDRPDHLADSIQHRLNQMPSAHGFIMLPRDWCEIVVRHLRSIGSGKKSTKAKRAPTTHRSAAT